jgi:hypothetical protein
LIEPLHRLLSLKQLAQRKNIKAVREKKQITYKSKPIKITSDFSTETLKAKGGME